jgi:DNA-dependent RNA polymerase auxiliary subunit epsilon
MIYKTFRQKTRDRATRAPTITDVSLRQTTQWPEEKRTKGQTIIYKILHRKLKIEQHESHYKPGVNPGDQEG